MTLPMHSPEARLKGQETKVAKLESSLTPRQRAAYERWLAACAKFDIGTHTEARYEFLRDLKDDVTS
jgi:hypothetical protein